MTVIASILFFGKNAFDIDSEFLERNHFAQSQYSSRSDMNTPNQIDKNKNEIKCNIRKRKW